jgi:tetratricopeptide (TPR) repeat protein
MGTADRFTRHEVQRILDVTRKQLDYWERLQLVGPRRRGGGERFYDFRDLISLRTAKQLTEQGVPAYRLRRSLLALQRKLAEVRAPLAELRILSDGRDVIVEQKGARVEPLSGQLVLNFDTRELDDKLRVMPERNAEAWFALGTEFQADPSTRPQAIGAYRQALEQDPGRVDALINLGALLYEQADFPAALDCFRRVVRREPGNPLAHYNLGSVLEELDQLEAARKHLREAVRLEPDYADAHYNLAYICEKLNAREEARQHWRRYLELDPLSPWCGYARERLSAETSGQPAPLPPKRR